MNKLGNKVITLPNNFMKKILKDTYNKTIYETKLLLTNNNYHYKLNTFKQQPVNPLTWEVGHLTNFYDIHLLKYINKNYLPLLKKNKIFDSYLTPLGKRFEIRPYTINNIITNYDDTYTYLDNWLDNNELNSKTSYLFLLSILHNHMHIESILYTKRSLMLKDNYISTNNSFTTPLTFIKIEGGEFIQGTKEGEYMITFDNEKPQFKTVIKSFLMSNILVTNEIYLKFINEYGYYNRKYWCEEGWEFIQTYNIKAPLYWEDIDFQWYINMTDDICNYKNINLNEPVCHISWYEAKAVAKWLGGRLPTEAEWEYVATNNGTTKLPWGNIMKTEYCNFNYSGNLSNVNTYIKGSTKHGIHQMIGNVWEWCEDSIYPYNGFCIDPIYREFSYPYFGLKKNLRGGSWAVPDYLIHPKYRNAQMPETRIQFTGVRVVKDHVR